MVAKKLAALTLWSSELNEDAMISIGDDLAGEIAYAFSQKEDGRGSEEGERMTECGDRRMLFYRRACFAKASQAEGAEGAEE